MMKTQDKPIKIGVVGARGYSGQEVCRILFRHPGVSLDSVFFNEGKTFSLWAQFPELEREARAHGKSEPQGHNLKNFFKSKHDLDVVFLATPNEVSLELAELFLNAGISVIDLSGIFRLNKVDAKSSQQMYLKHYGLEHSKPVQLKEAVYGLHPFESTIFSTIKKPFLIANPGCFVTSVLMGVLPLLAEGLLDANAIIIDAKSGASGAGKKLSESLLFSELYGDFYPYKVLSHQHVPEIEMYLKHFSKIDAKVLFTPHLLPVFRGILSTCYLKWSPALKAVSLVEKKSHVSAAFEKHFKNYPLVDWGPLPEKQKKISLKAVANSCMTHIAFDMDNDNLIVFSVLDNLLKGAASQAVENLNSIYEFSNQTGLE